MLSHDQNVTDEGLVAEGASGQSSLECLRGKHLVSPIREHLLQDRPNRDSSEVLKFQQLKLLILIAVLFHMYNFCITVISIKLNVMKIMFVLAPTVYFLKMRHKHVLVSLILHLRISMYYIFIICSLPERESPARPTQCWNCHPPPTHTALLNFVGINKICKSDQKHRYYSDKLLVSFLC